MSAHIEWLAARETSLQVFTPGEDWVGAGEHRQPVLTLAGDDVVAIQGTPAELRALAARISVVVAAAVHKARPRRRDRPRGPASMSDDATLRALESRATPGPWTPHGDKIRATAADALIPDNILVAYAGAHWQRLGIKKYPRGGDVPEHAPDVEFMAAARTALPDRLDRLDRIRDLHAKWGDQAPEDADGYLDLWETLGRLLDGEPA